MLSIDFHSAVLDDRRWVTHLLKYKSCFNSEYGFGNMFIWADAFKTEIGKYKDFLLIRSVTDDNKYIYSFPIGEGNVKEAVDYLINMSLKRSEEFMIFNATEEVVSFLEQNYTDCFEYSARREVYDYIYRTEDLIQLSGRKYHQKRNHISSFKKKYNWSFEKMDEKNIPECKSMYEQWIYDKNAENDEKYIEYDALIKALDNFEALGFLGGVLRVDGKVIAFTLGEELNSDVFCTHIEKANIKYDGAYSMINNCFAVNCLEKYKYINREEDMGIEGLRKSKLSYHPAFLLNKDLAVYRKNND